MMKNWNLFLPITIWLFATTAFAAPPIGIKSRDAVIIPTDMLLDDVDGVVAMSGYLATGKGENLLFVTADDDVVLKAKALHNLLQITGLTKATVVAGNPNGADSEFEYLNDYRNDGDKEYLVKLAALPDLKPWKPADYRKAIVEFTAAHEHTNHLLLANPLSIVDVLDMLDPSHVQQGIAMGIIKIRPDGSIQAGYNTNINKPAMEKYLAWAKKNSIPIYNVPSNEVTRVKAVSDAIHESRASLYHKGLQSVHEGLVAFSNNLTHVFFKNYGPNAPQVFIFHPSDGRSETTWLQDLMTVAVACNPHLAEWKNVDLSFATNKGDYAYPAVVRDTSAGSFYTTTKLNTPGVASSINDILSKVVVAPDFDPKTAINVNDQTSIVMITKSSIDDLGAIRMFLGLGKRLQLVVAESTHTPTIAAVIEKILRKFGRKGIEVAAGIGHTKDQLEAVVNKPMAIEISIYEKDLLARGILSKAEREELSLLDPTQFSATESLVKSIESSTQVDLVDTTSVEELHTLLTLRPDLIARLRTVHLMGGYRIVNGTGVVTRNWALNPEKTSEVLEILSRHNVKTYVYSSHQSGGTLSEGTMPRSVQVFQKLQKYTVEKNINDLRVDWNRGLEAVKPGFPIYTNYGPPLGWLMAARVALGVNADRYFEATPGTFTFDGANVTFALNRESSIQMIDNLETYGILDKTVAYLSAKAAKDMSLPTRILNRIGPLQARIKTWVTRGWERCSKLLVKE